MMFLKKQFEKKIENLFETKKEFKNYSELLKKFWEKDSEAVLEAVAKEIETHECSEDSLPYYRLWVEQLAELGDKASLFALRSHFLKMASLLEESSSWQALRGLVHLELDEPKSCSHLFELLKEEKEDAYALEFCEKYQRRFAEDGLEPLFLTQSKKALRDYFHFKTLAESSLLRGDFSGLENLLKYVDQSFSFCPLGKEFSFYKSLDEENFLEAKKWIEALLSDYKRREDYLFLEAYTLSRLGEHEDSNSVLGKILSTGKGDADIYSLLGENSYRRSFGDKDSSHWKNAVDSFLKAEAELSKEGLPTREPLLSLSLMSRHEKSVTKDESGNRTSFSYWLFNLKSIDFSRLMEAREEEIFYLHEKLGASPREGDLVFLASNKNLSGDTHLGAVYQVVSTPSWSHERGYETALELVARFDRALRLSRDFSSRESSCFQEAKKLLCRSEEKGCYLFSEKGLELLSEEISEQLEDKKLSQTLQDLTLKAV